MRPFKTVCTDEDPRWLEHRLSYSTGSEMCVLVGEEPKWWSTSYEDLLEQKARGIAVDITKGMEEKYVRAMKWGSVAEEGNIDIFAKSLGMKVRKTNAFLASTKNTRIASTLDGLANVPKELDMKPSGLWSDEKAERAFKTELSKCKGLGLVEAKQSAGWKGQVTAWTEGPPTYYFYQVQTQLYVTGLSWAVIFCRLGVCDLRAHIIRPDTFIHEEMEQSVNRFWEKVLDTPSSHR